MIAKVLADETLFILDPVVPIRILPAEKRRYAHQERYDPDDEDHDSDTFGGSLVDVVDVGHGPISVKSNNK